MKTVYIVVEGGVPHVHTKPKGVRLVIYDHDAASVDSQYQQEVYDVDEVVSPEVTT